MFWQDSAFTDSAREALRIALKLTHAARVEPEHVLIAQLQDEKSVLSRACLKLRPSVDLPALREALISSMGKKTAETMPDSWSEASYHARLNGVLAALQGSANFVGADAGLRERQVIGECFRAAAPRAKNVFGYGGVPADDLQKTLDKPPHSRDAPRPLLPTGEINPAAFDPVCRQVLRLMETEGKGLGLKHIGTPLILFALVSRPNGLVERGLLMQAGDPTALHKNLLLHLRALGKTRFDDDFKLHQKIMQPIVLRTFERAAALALERDRPSIGEAELVRALLLEDAYFVPSFLTLLKVDVKDLSTFVAQRPSGEEEPTVKEALPPTYEEIEQHLRQRIIGQEHVIDTVMPFLKRMRFGYARRGRPMGVLLFLGMSGTGKTQLAKEIARIMYGSTDQLTFLEMGQFGSEHSKTIFVGAPPGLVGYGEGLLTNGLRDRPESVVLFDEIEKAHKSVYDVVLRFLDEGMIADPAGPIRNGQRCIIILTSNESIRELDELTAEQSRGTRGSLREREQSQARVRQALLNACDARGEAYFRPEFINRVDELIVFKRFDEDSYRKILQLQMDEEVERLHNEKRRSVLLDESVREFLLKQCLQRTDEGARVCGKLLSTLVIGPLIDFFGVPGQEDIAAVQIVVKDDAIVVRASEGDL